MRGEAGRTCLVNAIQRKLHTLEALPIRPATAWTILGLHQPALNPQPLEPIAQERLEADPGWVLGLLATASKPTDLRTVRDRSWWHPPDNDARLAVESLWRHAAAVAWTARNLAFHRKQGDPRSVAWLALVSPLGAWALAAVAPELLATWLKIDDPAQRLQWERTTLGNELGWIGRSLAVRWRLPHALREAAWQLHEPDELAHEIPDADRDALTLIRHARRWVDRTQFRLFPRTDSPAPSSSFEVKKWMAALQAWLPVSFYDPKASPREERLARAHASAALDMLQERQLAAAGTALLEQIGTTAPGESPADWRARANQPDTSPTNPTPHPDHAILAAATEAIALLLEENQQLERALRDAIRAGRPRAAESERTRRQELLDAMAQFAAGAGHELNNPLAVVMGRAQLLLSRVPDDPEARHGLRAIISQAQRAHRMLRDLMYVARPTTPRPRLCQPDDLIKRSVDDLRAEAESRGVVITLNTPEPAPAVFCDPDQIRHLADVLIRNALEVSPAGATVRVATRRHAGKLIVRVEDEGPGIDADESRRLLLPFYCGRQAGRGLGMGLSRVARYLALVGGHLEWTRRTEVGMVFQANLPLVSELPRMAS